MEQKGQSTPIVILDTMLSIIQGQKNAQSPAMGNDQHQLYLVDENGRVNEMARSALVENIKVLKSILVAQQQPPKTSSSFFKGFFSTNTKKAQMFIPAQISTQSTKGFAEVFTKLLKDNSIKCDTVNNGSDLVSDLPLIVVCPAGSRLEPSIDHALENFSWNCQFVAVILHFGTESSLPALGSAKKLPLKNEYRNALFIDAGYNTDANFYDCQLNKTAFERIKMFIENFQK